MSVGGLIDHKGVKFDNSHLLCANMVGGHVLNQKFLRLLYDKIILTLTLIKGNKV